MELLNNIGVAAVIVFIICPVAILAIMAFMMIFIGFYKDLKKEIVELRENEKR